MTIRRKTLILTAALLIALMGALYAASRLIVMDRLAAIEEREVANRVDQAVAAIERESVSLAELGEDYARWDATYEYARHPQQSSFVESFEPGYLAINIDLIAVVSPAGQVLFGTVFEKAGRHLPLPPGFEQYLPTLATHGVGPGLMTPLRGLARVRNGVLIVAAHPIRRSDNSGPAAGTLVLARWLDGNLVGALARSTRLAITVSPSSGPLRTDVATRVVDENRLIGSTVLPDINGHPAAEVLVSDGREVYDQGFQAVVYFAVIVVYLTMLFGLLLVAVFERVVLSRIVDLSGRVTEIGEVRDLAVRVPVRGSDELSRLAANVNIMLAGLETARNTLVESEQRFHIMADHAPVLIWVADPSGQRTYFNEGWLRFTGRAPGDEAGQGWTIGVHPDDLARCMAAVESARASRQGYVVEYRLKGADGTYGWLFEQAAPRMNGDGEFAGFIGSCVDLTERKRVEDERARLGSAVEGSAESIAIISRDGAIEYVNSAFERLTGYSAHEVRGRRPSLLKSGKHDEAFYQTLWETVLAGLVWHEEVTNRRKDGTTYTQELTIIPVRGRAGEVEHFIAIGQDTTDRRRLEAQLLQAQKMEAIGRLAGGVAHDFNNLLTIILGYTEVLREQAAEVPACQTAADAIGGAAERASALTRQLLAFSRRQVVAPKILDLNDTVADVEKMIRRLVGEDVRLTLTSAPGLGRVKADPSQIEQVLMNLVVNARDSMPDGGELTIETDNVELDEAYARRHAEVRPGPYVMLAVTDTGSGMDAATRERIFEPFFTTKEPGKGTGLGLATVYGIVKQSDGYVWVYSEPGIGTSFKVYFPRVDEEADRAPEPALADTPRGTETILVAEDEEGVRHLLRDVLHRLGYTVLEAQHGEEALLFCQRFTGPIHLLLTDVVMPGVSGKALADRVVPLRPNIKVVFMSGYTDHAIQRTLLDEGAMFLQKPFTPDIVGRKVREALDARRPSRVAPAA